MKNFKKVLLLSSLICTLSSNISADEEYPWDILIRIFFGSNNNNKPTHDGYPPQQQHPQAYSPQPSINTNKYEQVDYSRVRQEFKSAFDNIFATSYQNKIDQDEITQVRNKSSNHVIEILQTQYGNLTEQQSKQEARKLAQKAAVEFVGEKSDTFIYDELYRIRNNPPINPEILRSQIKEEMLIEAQKQISNKYGSLREYAGEQLRRKVAFKIDRAFGVYEPKPSAPPMEQSIKNIFPKNGGSSMKIFYTEECCTCQESFKDIGKQVVLQCGHTVCPSCLYQWVYQTKKNTCPLCRAIINNAEFPADYLRQNF